jgi:hypothetical protein
MNQEELRRQVVQLLDGRQAHEHFEEVLREIPFHLQGTKPSGAAHTPWEILEHLRIAQWDILEFSRSSEHVSPSFPEGYWPETPEPPREGAWKESLERYRSDLLEMKSLLQDPENDLFVPFPHGKGQTLLREALVLADHNAYHLGEMVCVRRQLGVWPDSVR